MRGLPALLRLPAAALLLGLAAAAGAMPAAGETALAAPFDLQQDARQAARRGKPLIILFSLPGCAYCQVVRQNYLVPLVRDLPPQERPVVREVDIAGGGTFAGLRGERTSGREFAAAYRVRFAPTVVLLDGAGRLLAPAIVGGDTAGLYGGYLDNALAEAARRLSAAGKSQ